MNKMEKIRTTKDGKEKSDKSTAKLWHCQIDKIEYLDEVWDKIKKTVIQEELSKYED